MCAPRKTRMKAVARNVLTPLAFLACLAYLAVGAVVLIACFLTITGHDPQTSYGIAETLVANFVFDDVMPTVFHMVCFALAGGLFVNGVREFLVDVIRTALKDGHERGTRAPRRRHRLGGGDTPAARRPQATRGPPRGALWITDNRTPRESKHTGKENEEYQR